jgi:uncharacterized RDD family membrane protein YckC
MSATTTGLLCVVVAALAGGAARGEIGDGAGEERLLACAGGEHLWLVLPARDPQAGVSLLHQGPLLDRGRAQTQRTLSLAPAAMANWGPRLWMAFAARDGRCEIFTLEASANVALGSYTTRPRDRLEALEPLRVGELDLHALVGTPDGPVALVVGAGRAPGLEPPALLRLEGAEWRPLPLPPQILEAGPWHLVPPGPDGAGLTLLAPARGLLARLDQGGAFILEPAPAPPGPILDVARIGDHPLLVRRASGGDAPLDLEYLQAGMAVPLCTVDAPPGPWAIVGLRDAPHLLQIDRDQQPILLTARRIDPRSGAMDDPVTILPPALASRQLWHISMLLAVTVTLALLVLVVRPQHTPITCPAGWRVLPAGRRLASAAIDLVPGGALGLWAMDAVPADLLRAPIFTADLADCGAYLVMAGITLAHCTASECLSRRTLGKAMVGGRVISADGRTGVPLRRLLLRNLGKLMVLLAPPLVLLGMLNTNLQGVPDQLGGTCVAGRRAAPEPDPGGDR